MATVSVILCSYNQAEYIADAIRSVIEQSYEDWELIVVDNGSTDRSAEVLAPFAEDPRIRVILHEKNEAITRRLNDAIAVSTGKYISILYSDDYYLLHKLASQVVIFDRLPADYGVVYSPGFRLDVSTGQQWIYPTPRCSGLVLGQLLDDYSRGLYVNPISPLMRRECLERYRFHEDLFVEGETILFRIAMKYRFHFDEEPTTVMRDHSRNMGRQVKIATDMIFTCLDRLEVHPDFPEELRSAARRAHARILRNSGWLAVRIATDMSWARGLFLRSVRTDWRQAIHPKTVVGLGLSMVGANTRAAVHRKIVQIRKPKGHVDSVPE